MAKPFEDPQIPGLLAHPKYEVFLESLVENPQIQESYAPALNWILTADPWAFQGELWLNWLDGKPIPGLGELQDSHYPVVYRWLLDKTLRTLESRESKKQRRISYDIVNEVLDRLVDLWGHETLEPLIEALLPMTSDPWLLSDLYHWLYTGSSQTNHQVQSLLYAHQGLHWAKTSEDRERIAWAIYNLAHFYTTSDLAAAEQYLDEALDYLRDERYFDILGHIALGYLDQDKLERAQVYLESVFHFFKRTLSRKQLFELSTLPLNLVYFCLNLAWIYFENAQWTKAQEISDLLVAILSKYRKNFLDTSDDLGSDVVDGKYQVYAYTAEAFFWSYTTRLKTGNPTEAEIVAQDLRKLMKTCPYDLNSLVQEFSEETGIPLPWPEA